MSCNRGYDINIASPNLGVNDSTTFTVSEITENGAEKIKVEYEVTVSDGLELKDETITANEEGLENVTLTVDGVSFIYTISVNDTSTSVKNSSDCGSEYDFDGESEIKVLSFTEEISKAEVEEDGKKVLFIRSSDKIYGDEQQPENETNQNGGKHGTSGLFGNDLTDYTVNTDFKCLYANAIVDATIGIGLRAGKNGHYQVSYAPIVKIDKTTNQITNNAETLYDRLVITKATVNSGQQGNMVSHQTLLAYSDSELSVLNNERAFDKYYRLSASVSGNVITATLYDENNEEIGSISTDITGDETYLASGQTLINAANTDVYVDSIEIVPNQYEVKKLTLTADGLKLSAVASGTPERTVPLEDLKFIYDKSLVEVDRATGLVSIKRKGNAYITAVYKGKKYATVKISE